MKIARIAATVHAASSRVPLLDGGIEDYRDGPPRPFVVCRVDTDDGLTGFGFTGRFMARHVAAVLEYEILPVVRGMDPRDADAVQNRLREALNPRGMTGIAASAFSALDIALWDLRGQAEGVPVAALIGAARKTVPAYLTFGMPQYDRRRLAEAARLGYRRGFRLLKMVVAVDPGGWQEDAKRIRAAHEALPADAKLIIDANEGFSEAEALSLARAVADCRIAWFEEPVNGNDPAAIARLRAATGLKIGAGQMEADPRIFGALLDAGVEPLQPNVLYCGGFSAARRIAKMAEARPVGIANGAGWPLVNLHLVAGVPNGWLVESHIAQSGIEEAVFLSPPSPVDGSLAIPEKPGLGIAINAEGLGRTRLDA